MNDVCSLCDVVEAGPYCPVHGTVHRAFAIGGRYDVDSLMMASAAAFVFAAVDRTSRREVAIKILRTERVDAPWCMPTPVPRPAMRESQREFQRAAATLAQLPSEQASEILNVGRDDELGVTYVVIDRLSVGAELASWPIGGAGGHAAGHAAGHPTDDAGATHNATTRQTGAVSVLDALERMALPDMIGSYRVVRELGAGGTGRVYLGEHPVIGTKVAIKVLLPEIAQQGETVGRFLQEARASSQIGSPHIPRYFDFGTMPTGQPFAVMEYFEGETLGKRLARGGPMSVADTAQIIDQVAGALQMAHDAGLIHRDLKPENLLLVEPSAMPGRLRQAHTASMAAQPGTRPIEVKLLDFGIAKVVGRRSATQTQTGAFLGTPFYCAPEQVFGHDVDARTDVYSLGATAFEMLTGAPPFIGEVPEILSAKATEQAPDPRAFGVPDVVAETIRAMLARDPRDRAPSMAWVRSQVARWTRPGGAESRPPLEHGETAQMPAVRPPDESARLGRADTAMPPDLRRGDDVPGDDVHGDGDDRYGDDRAARSDQGNHAGSVSAAMSASTELDVPVERSRLGLWLAGAGLIAAAAATVLLISPFHGRTQHPAPPPAASNPPGAPLAQGAAQAPLPAPVAQAAAPSGQPAAPAAPPSEQPAAPAVPPSEQPAAPSAPPSAQPAPIVVTPTAAAPTAPPHDAVAPRPRTIAPGEHAATPRSPRTPGDPRAPADRELPASAPRVKPAEITKVKRPAPGDAKRDVIIVDPYSQGH